MAEEGGPANSVQAAKKLPTTDEAAVIAAVAEEANDYYVKGCQERKPTTDVAAAPGYVALDPVVMPAILGWLLSTLSKSVFDGWIDCG